MLENPTDYEFTSNDKKTKVALSWRLANEVMKRSQHALTVLQTFDGGGQYDCLTLTQPGSEKSIRMNRNGQNALSFNGLVEQIWVSGAKNAQLTAEALIRPDYSWNSETDFDAHRSDLLAATSWVAEVLRDTNIEIEWCVNGDSYGPEIEINDQIPGMSKLPAHWLQQAQPDSYYPAEAWLWALKSDEKYIAIVNILQNEALELDQSNISQTHPGPKFIFDKATKISFDAALALGKYVYALRDPRSKQVFYVGKGTGDRVVSHKKFADENPEVASAKLDRIREIETSGFNVEHLLIRTGLASDEEAYAVEQAVIDAFAASNVELTNLVKGHGSDDLGLISLDEFLIKHFAEPLPTIETPLVMFKIQAKWQPGMTDEEVYESTRGHWVIGEETRNTAELAIGIAHGVVRSVYRITTWQMSPGFDSTRWNFTGEKAEDLQHLVGKRVSAKLNQTQQNPIFKLLSGYQG